MDHHATIGRQRQRGYVLLSMVAVIGLLTATAATSIGETALVRQQSDKNKMVLAKAREALISRAASDANHPGSLPCPDAVTNIPGNNIPNDGIADLLSGTACPSAIGRWPRRWQPDRPDAERRSGFDGHGGHRVEEAPDPHPQHLAAHGVAQAVQDRDSLLQARGLGGHGSGAGSRWCRALVGGLWQCGVLFCERCCVRACGFQGHSGSPDCLGFAKVCV